jgi:hydroxymethylglutaryl-CoA lyase
LLDMGCTEISLGDTTGMGTAPRTQALFRVLRDAGVPMQRLAGHFHDTYGQALVNCAVALDAGVRVFDSSVAGLGGCPYAKGATGNVATEEVVYFLQSVGIESGLDLEEIAGVGEWISDVLRRENGSRVGKALLARKRG